MTCLREPQKIFNTKNTKETEEPEGGENFIDGFSS
jgi:hypothetical protein